MENVTVFSMIGPSQGLSIYTVSKASFFRYSIALDYKLVREKSRSEYTR